MCRCRFQRQNWLKLADAIIGPYSAGFRGKSDYHHAAISNCCGSSTRSNPVTARWKTWLKRLQHRAIRISHIWPAISKNTQERRRHKSGQTPKGLFSRIHAEDSCFRFTFVRRLPILFSEISPKERTLETCFDNCPGRRTCHDSRCSIRRWPRPPRS